MNIKVLVVEDIPAQQKLLQKYLSMKDYEVIFADNGENAINNAKKNKPDIIILDLYLPDMDGIKVCEFLRQEKSTSKIPIIMVTARGGVGDIVNGLKAGSDDYICKPYNFQELLARIEVVLRRTNRIENNHNNKDIIKKDNLTINLNERKIFVNNKSVNNITRKEFDIITILVKKSPDIIESKYLIETVWKNETYNNHTLETHIYTLRKKLGSLIGKKIISVYGFGYKFED